MENETNVERLAGWVIKLGILAVILAACWYFRSVLVYVLVAFVVSLIGHPLMEPAQFFRSEHRMQIVNSPDHTRSLSSGSRKS